MKEVPSLNWLGWQGSNLRMTGPKPVALPLGDIPKELAWIATITE